MIEICGNCKYRKQENIDSGWVCVNPKSEYCGEVVDYDDDCLEWYMKDDQDNWIPVSERLPEKGQYVLASVCEDYAEHNIAEHEVIICRCEEQSFWSNGIITAWQPLPDPYKESEKE